MMDLTENSFLRRVLIEIRKLEDLIEIDLKFWGFYNEISQGKNVLTLSYSKLGGLT